MAVGQIAFPVLGQAETTSSRHVTLIRTGLVAPAGTWSMPVTPPLGIAYLAAALRESGAEVDAIDAVGEAPDQLIERGPYLFQGLMVEETVERIDSRTDIVAISCMFTQDWPWSRQLIRAVRERFPDKLIIAGGEHISALPEFSLRESPELDLIVMGEGEETLVDVVRNAWDRDRLSSVPGTACMIDGEFHRNEPRQRIRDVEALPRPAWDLFPMELYLCNRNSHGVYRGRTMPILATRGCPYKCTFCSNPLMYGKLWMARDPDDVLDEIQTYIDRYQAENIDFYDLTMVLKRQWILDFCRRIHERGMQFTWQLPTGTRSEVVDDEVAGALYGAGCRNLAFAPESGSTDTLDRIKKRVNLDKMVAAMKVALKSKMVLRVNLIVGFPHETRRHVLDTIRFGCKLALVGVHDAAYLLFSPYPGTELFEELRQDGLIADLDDDYFRAILGMKSFSPIDNYCRHLGPRELAFWRVFGMASFFAVSFARRPWRFVRLIHSLIINRGEWALEQRLNAALRRKKRPKREQSSMQPALTRQSEFATTDGS